MSKTKPFIFLYILVVIFTYLFFAVKDFVNIWVLSLITGIFAVLLLWVFVYFAGSRDKLGVGGGNVRYNMLCHGCNWEWLSNVRSGDRPIKCPKCGNHSRLEVVGWKRVPRIPEKRNEELAKFFDGGEG